MNSSEMGNYRSREGDNKAWLSREGIKPSQIFGLSAKGIAQSRKINKLVFDTLFIFDKTKQIENLEKLKKIILNKSSKNYALASKVVFFIVDRLSRNDALKESAQEIIHELKLFQKEWKQLARADINTSYYFPVIYKSAREASEAEEPLPEIDKSYRYAIDTYLTEEKYTIDDFIQDVKLNANNAHEILQAIKIVDLENNRKSDIPRHSRSSYELRTLCMQASQGKIHSFEAYTYSINTKMFENPFSPQARKYAIEEFNYVPERVRDHQQALRIISADMMAMSRRFNDKERTIYCLGGGSGVGKSYTSRNDPQLARGLLPVEKGDGKIVYEAVGAQSPDRVKTLLRKNIPGITDEQIHQEGVQLARRLNVEYRKSAVQSSLITDEWLGSVPIVTDVIKMAKETHSRVIYKDLDAPLVICCLRILGRDIYTEPSLPFENTLWGFKHIRIERSKVIDLVLNEQVVENYQLIVGDLNGISRVAAEKNADGTLKVVDAELLAQAQNCPTDKELDAIGDTILSDDFLKDFANVPGVNVEAVSKHKNKTLRQAMLDNSLRMPTDESRFNRRMPNFFEG